ncbi:hypothetical protein [Puniceibacterium sp. IMCC21224]|uniref:hypothetical protein n=1 Tax=Puniceibacterium sp. IMCC21224 TaxID=1618204 RepID=UPI00064D9F90|nr:hypothetical protein [Puniceibacterium sp. IMCC21224]KMK63955.1 hypothetical protein IMCC21224_1613 [Puniceibacterium sp. IMCC21224]
MQQHPIAAGGQGDTDSGFTAFVLSNPDGVFQKCDDLATFVTMMDTDAARGLLLYDPPAECLAKWLASGHVGGAELDRWATGAMGYLKLRRKVPNRFVILEKPGDPTALAAVRAAFEKAFPGAEMPFSTPLSNRAEPFYGALAALAVAQHAIAARLHTELQAGSATSFHQVQDPADSLQAACAAWERLIADRDSIELSQSQSGIDIAALQDAHSTARSETATIRSELEAALAAKAQASDLQRLIGGQLKELEGELASLQSENAALSQTISSIGTRETEAQAALRDARDDLAKAIAAEIAAQAALRAAQDQLTKAAASEVKIQAALRDARDELTRTQTSLTAAGVELRITTGTLDKTRTSEIDARATIKVMERDLATARADNADGRDRLNAVLEELSATRTSGNAAQQEVQTLRAAQDQHARSDSVLVGQIRQLEGELLRAQTRQTEQVRQLTAELQKSEQLQLKTLQKTRALETRIGQDEQSRAEILHGKILAEQAVEALTYELSLVYSSSSWRMSKPLRFFKRMFGGADSTPGNESKT